MRIAIAAIVLMVSAVPGVMAEEPPYCGDSRYANVPRCFAILESSGLNREHINLVYVDNASSMDNGHAAELVLAADRSTQNGNVTTAARKGLMADQDRVCVTDRYLAWFDYSVGDGTRFDPVIYSNDTTRAGALAGFWTLDPTTRTFKNSRPDPTGSGSAWAHNELIPGSASPNGEQYWWDPYGPPIEHTFAIPTTADPRWDFFLLTYEYGRRSKNSGWAISTDGRRDADGVHYATKALMTSWQGVVDVVDGEDAIDIKNSVQATMEYICRSDDIVTVWRFKPDKANIVVDNLYVIIWAAYTPNIDGTRCDQNRVGNQWPGPVFGQPLYGQSSETLRDNIVFTSVAPGGVAKLPIQEPPCNRRNDGTYPDYHNNSVGTEPAYAIKAGSWMTIRESPDSTSAGWRFTNLDVPLSGRGTEDDPIRIAWKDIGVAHENADGTIVFGASTMHDLTVLRAGVWYQSTVSIRSAQ